MKKLLVLFTLIFLSVQNIFAWGFAVRDVSRQPSENPTYYLGDQVSFQWDINSDGWGATLKKAGIGSVNTSGAINWMNIVWVDDAGDGYGGNEGIKSNPATVSSVGTWYYALWLGWGASVGDNGRWYTGFGTWNEGNASFLSSSFTVNALETPISVSATTASSFQINLSWTKWNSKNVMIVRKKSTDAWVEPTQGTPYTVGTTIPNSNCDVVYNNSGTNFTDIDLSSSTGYDYKFYSENYSYYSAGVTASATTSTGTTDYFKSNATGDWNSVLSWQSSFNNSNWIDATLAPTSAAGSVSITHAITVTSAETAHNLTIGADGVLTINPTKSLTVTGTLTNSAGTAGLVVKADASGFGSLIESNGVNATVESYFSPNRWHFISAPVADLYSGMFEGLYLQEHSETGGFTDVTSLVLPLWPTQGFALWGGTSGGFTKSYIGNLNVSDYNGVGLYRDAGGTDRGWNLIGNPYPSVLDWNLVTKSLNVNSAIYIENAGGWAIYNNGVGIPNNNTRYIAPGQGVFVQVTDGGAETYPNTGTVSITNAARVHNTSAFYKSTEATNLVRVQVSGNTYTDEAVVRFAPDATLEFDGNYDAHKFFAEISGNAQIYTLGSTSLAINALPSETSSVSLGIRTDMAGTYTIAATELLEIPVVALEDTKTGTFTDLISGSYTFTIEPGENELRFMLHFGTTSVPENEKSISSIYSYQQTVYVNLADNTQGDIYIYNLAGQLVTAKESASGNVRIGLNSMGVYMVKVVTEKETLTQKVVIR